MTKVKPELDAKFRTARERESTGILGSSMGGLFAFFAAWTRPDMFRKAACRVAGLELREPQRSLKQGRRARYLQSRTYGLITPPLTDTSLSKLAFSPTDQVCAQA